MVLEQGAVKALFAKSDATRGSGDGEVVRCSFFLEMNETMERMQDQMREGWKEKGEGMPLMKVQL